jgi:hypothetical protein
MLETYWVDIQLAVSQERAQLKEDSWERCFYVGKQYTASHVTET